MGRMQDCAQHTADRLDLHLGETTQDPLVHGAVALERKCGERRWALMGSLTFLLHSATPARLVWLDL